VIEKDLRILFLMDAHKITSFEIGTHEVYR